MELTRRDALAALAGAGILGGGAAAAVARDERADSPADDDRRGEAVDALVATARVVYPSPVENVREFVAAYANGKLTARPAFREGVVDVLDDLDEYAGFTFDARYVDLDDDQREQLLREMGAKTADPDPDGLEGERVRYYYVNEVLFALYTSPTGGELVGVENPQGHPGGTDTYQRGPSRR